MKTLFGLACILILCMMTAGCNIVNEEDLAALASDNPVLKQKALKKISETNGLLFGLEDFFGGRENEEKAVGIMVKLLKNGKEPGEIEAEILHALGKLSDKCDVPISVLIDKISDDDPVVQIQAVEAVANARARESSPSLVKQLQGNRNKYVIIWALGEIGDKEVIPALSALLHDEDENVQYNARKALEKIEAPEKEQEERKPIAGEGSRMVEWLTKVFNEEYQKAMICVFRKIEDFRNG